MRKIAKKPMVAVVFGTRPEAIKMAPVIRALREKPEVKTVVISTGQHRQMLAPLLETFRIKVDHDLELMESNQSLYQLSSKAMVAFEKVIECFRPSLILVQGDTTTAFLGSLCAFYGKVSVGHIEAGLRTDDKYRPFPEEIHRRIITAVADLNFCPTEKNRTNLLREGVPESTLHVTGNPGIDALMWAVGLKRPFPLPEIDLSGKRMILVTVHRRETFGKPLYDILNAIRDLASLFRDVVFVFPVHLNPNIQKPAHEILHGFPNIRLCAPMDYVDFVSLMKRSHLILTDSGGVQEEAPTLGKPVLVLRDETERLEAVQAGAALLVGTRREDIVREVKQLLDHDAARDALIKAIHPYGDGKAALRIAELVIRHIS